MKPRITIVRLLSTLVISATVVGAAGIYGAYRHDLAAARVHASVGSQTVQTLCGPIEYAEAGEGIPMLVVHGAGGGFDQGSYFAAPLTKRGFRAIAMSRFGYLRTPLPADASAEAQARAHVCLLDALHIQHAAIVGASAGAPSSILFALKYPERTTALVLLVPATYVPRLPNQASLRTPPGTQFFFSTILRSDFLLWVASHVARQAVTRSILATPTDVVESASREEQERVQQVLESILPIDPRRLGLLNDAAVTSTLSRYDLEHISVPTFVMSTEDDLYGTFDGARYTAEHIPRAKFLGFDRGGHLWVGHQEEVLSSIERFVKGAMPPNILVIATPSDDLKARDNAETHSHP